MSVPKKVGLALGGGGAKGLAHIGVIKALEDAGVEISFIAGTSMGALVGGWYAATGDITALENIFLRVKRKDLVPKRKMIRKKDIGLFKNSAIIDLLEDYLKGVTFEKCRLPFAAIATDVKHGDEVVLRSGNLEEAIRASTALPIVFAPVEIGERLLMDGGFVNPVPADIVKEMGAEYVLAVDVSSRWFDFSEETLGITHVYSMIPKALSVIEYQIARRILEKADLVLSPPVTGFGWLALSSAREIIAAGEREVKNHLRDIMKATGTPERPKTPAKKILDFLFYRD